MKKIYALIVVLAACHVSAQINYDESTSPINLPTGISYQSGLGDNNTTNWTYPYGSKLSVNTSAYRNFEITTTSYPYGQLKLRQWDPTNNAWTVWRSILLSDWNGSFRVNKGDSGGLPHGFSDLTIEDDTEGMISILTPNTRRGYFGFADQDDDYVGGMQYDHNTDKMTFRVNNHVSDMVINSNGYVGIGTTSPNNLLQVQSPGGDNQVAKLQIKGTGQNNAGTLNNVSLSGCLISGTADAASFNRFNVGIESWYGIGFKSSYNNTAGIVFDTRRASAFFEGKVGIGTDSPDSKLTVAGNIHAQEVKVTVDAGADFVFEEDYKLPSLETLETFIKTNKHLPEIASEKEMQANGLQLAGMNIKLLQKIEELTLYTIAQEKKLEKQQKEIDNQKVRVEEFQKENQILKSVLQRIEKLEEQIK